MPSKEKPWAKVTVNLDPTLRQAWEDLVAENERYGRIRDLLVKAVVRATGAEEDAVREAPLTCAIRHADEVERLRAERDSAVESYQRCSVVIGDQQDEVERLREAQEGDEEPEGHYWHREPVDEDDMCPNCVTPWKCNGPHLRMEQR